MPEKEYIEREAVLKVVSQIMCDVKVHHKHRAINRNIKQLPTADVREVKHSKWEYEDSDIGWTDYRCDSCGNIITTVAEPDELYKYCPYCGAKMDKGGEQE